MARSAERMAPTPPDRVCGNGSGDGSAEELVHGQYGLAGCNSGSAEGFWPFQLCTESVHGERP